MKKGIFITIEGPEGGGKSTQARLLCERLREKGMSVVHTREPGGTKVAEAIRHILLTPDFHVHPITELLLYEASRAQHTFNVILPALKNGKSVVSERYTDATLAYQGYGRGLDLKIIGSLNNVATGGLKSDMTVYLDISSAAGLLKAKKKNDFANGDRIENESLKFHKKVRQGYLKLAKRHPGRIKVVKVKDTIEATHKDILKLVEKRLCLKKS